MISPSSRPVIAPRRGDRRSYSGRNQTNPLFCSNDMSEVSRSSKRTRSLSEEDSETEGLPWPASSGNPAHDEEFWLEDGNIVLISCNIAFRIHRGLLAAQSSIFADMFTAASSSADESYEGCPVIHLSESPEDLRHFLRVLLPKSQRTYVSSMFMSQTIRLTLG